MSRLSIFSIALLLAASGFLADGAMHDASALCAKGTPHCLKPHRPVPTHIGGIKQPPPGDPECKAYPASCHLYREGHPSSPTAPAPANAPK